MNTHVLLKQDFITKSDLWIVRGFALLTMLGAFVYSFFMDRPVVFDELGLHNPIYMYLHYGQMTYPVHGYFDSMIVHPPFHYLLIALFMKAGLGLFQGAGLPIFLLSLLTIYLIVNGNFIPGVKISLLIGLFCTIFIWADFYTIRPDLHLSMAWFAGLIALETARLSGWNNRLLAIGSFFSTYASGVHYWGASAFIVLLLYGGWMVREIGWKNARFKLLVMAIAAALFAIPYFVLFVLPNWPNIRSLTAQVQGSGGLWDAFQRHLFSYEVFAKRLDASWQARPLTTLITYPVLTLRIPAIFVATTILWLKPCTRGLALGGAILPLFVLFFSQKKAIGYTGYFTPEFILYMAALLIAVMAIVEFVIQRLASPRQKAVVAWVGAIALAIPLCTSIPTTLGFDQVKLTPRLDDLEIGRAAGREILGANALMPALSASHWYTLGSDRWANVSQDLAYPKYTQMDWQNYLAQFNGVAVDDAHWNFTLKEGVPVPTWYTQGKLGLKGFFFNNRHAEPAIQSSPLAFFACEQVTDAGFQLPARNACSFIDFGMPENYLSYLILDEKRAEQVVGYGYGGDGKLSRFEEAKDGEYLFFSQVCPSNRYADFNFRFFFSFSLDGAGFAQPHVISGVLPEQNYGVAQKTTLSGCQPQDEIRGRLVSVDQQALLAKLAKEDKSIRFYQTVDAAKEAAKS